MSFLQAAVHLAHNDRFGQHRVGSSEAGNPPSS